MFNAYWCSQLSFYRRLKNFIVTIILKRVCIYYRMERRLQKMTEYLSSVQLTGVTVVQGKLLSNRSIANRVHHDEVVLIFSFKNRSHCLCLDYCSASILSQFSFANFMSIFIRHVMFVDHRKLTRQRADDSPEDFTFLCLMNVRGKVSCVF